jgi:hypothetical protein
MRVKDHPRTEVPEKYLEAITKYPPDENLGTQVVPAAVKRSDVNP